MTYPYHVHDMGGGFWNRIRDTFGLNGEVVISGPSPIETALLEHPVRTVAAMVLKVPARVERIVGTSKKKRSDLDPRRRLGAAVPGTCRLILMPHYAIPFNRSSLVGRELEYIFKAMTIGQIAGDQTFTRNCHALLERELGVRKVLLTTSCTHALEIERTALGIGAADEVIIPSFTFVSTVNAFVLRGAKPVFCDVRPDTLNLDEKKLEALITPKTKAIVPVHYAGSGWWRWM
jgi:hypothetical protein